MIRVLTVAVLLAGPAFAAEPVEETPAAAAEASQKDVPAPEAAPAAEAAPAPAAEPANEPPRKEACPEPAAAKTGVGCARALEGLVAGYRKAADDLDAWLEEGSAQVRDVAAKESDLQERIKKNEAALTDLKLKGAKRSEIKELEQANKGLWKELGDVSKERAALCRDIARRTGEKAREIGGLLRDELARTLSGMR